MSGLLFPVAFEAAPTEPRWRLFGFTEIEEAVDWACVGGVAVHLFATDGWPTGPAVFRRKGAKIAHLFARDEVDLRAAALAVGCSASWIQRPRLPRGAAIRDTPAGRRFLRERLHYDLTGAPLERALARCAADAEGGG